MSKELKQPAQQQQERDYTWPTVADYENDVGFKVNQAFKMAWDMARITNSFLNLTPQPVQQEQLEDALQSLDFYRRRVEALQQWQSKMRDPERTIVCDIIANGRTLEPAGDRYKQPAQQEPVAWTLTEELEKRETTTRAHLWFSNPMNCMWTPLYTSPPAQRTWVGLTQEEFRDFASTFEYGTGGLIRAIEAKLKEKNT